MGSDLHPEHKCIRWVTAINVRDCCKRVEVSVIGVACTAEGGATRTCAYMGTPLILK
jgi:hypothetical protein